MQARQSLGINGVGLKQYDSISFNEGGDRALCICMCGALEHGLLAIHKDRQDAEMGIQFSAVPWPRNFWGRIQNAWDVFWCRPVNVDLVIAQHDAVKLGNWLADSCEQQLIDCLSMWVSRAELSGDIDSLCIVSKRILTKARGEA